MLKLHSILNKAWQVWHVKLTWHWLIFFCRTIHVKKGSFRGWNFKNYFSLTTTTTTKKKTFKNYKNCRAIIFFINYKLCSSNQKKNIISYVQNNWQMCSVNPIKILTNVQCISIIIIIIIFWYKIESLL